MQAFLDDDFNNIDSRTKPGFTIHLHAPNDYPWPSKSFLTIPPNTNGEFEIKAKMKTTSQSLKKYTPHQRRCYFEGERYLKFFKIYTESNCKFECLTNYTLKKCDCVRLSMPRHDNTAKICMNRKEINCCDITEKTFFERELSEDFDEISGENKGKALCNCLPSCTAISYKTTMIPTKTLKTWFKLVFYFTETHFTASNRIERYGLIDFIANCGGILGKNDKN
jgi:acid-sensing ion channel, other